MAINFAKTSYAGHFPEIWRGECKMLPGGFKPVQDFAAGVVLHRGTAVSVDFDAHTAAVCKVAKVITGGTTSKVRIAKGHCFAAGDVIMKVGKNDKSPAISSIDTSTAGYDVLNLASAITGLTAGDVITEATPYGYIDAESTDEGALKIVASEPSDGQIALASVTPYLGEKTLAANDYVKLQNASPKYAPNAVLGAVKEFDGKGIDTLDVAYEAVVLYPSLSFPVLDSWKSEGSPCMKNNPNIIFITQ